MTNYRHGQMIHIIDAMDSPLLAVQPARCLLVRHRNADCLRCAAVCTTGAISLGDEGIVVSPEACIGCGTCASACPTGCLTAAKPTDGELFATVEEAAAACTGKVALICETALKLARGNEETFTPGAPVGTLGDGRCAVGVVCLGRAEESLLVEATARGAQSIQLIGGSCETCVHHRGGALCDAIVDSAENLLAAMGAPSPIERVIWHDGMTLGEAAVEPDADHQTVSATADDPAAIQGDASDDSPSERKRVDPSVRTALKPGHATTFTPEFPHVQADGTLPHFVPERRLRLFNSLKALGTPRKSHLTTRLWGQVSINTELCRSCRMCTVFCPTGAVSRFDAGDGAFGVEHRSALCMQCGLCETICPEDAITINDEVDADEFLTGRKFRFTMQPVGWNPGAEDAIASRMARFIKVDNMQEPQAKVKSNDTAERRDYAWQREARRREIRGQ